LYLIKYITLNIIIMECKYVLKNSQDEFIKAVDTRNGNLIFTKDINEAYDYDKLGGGGPWAASAQLDFYKHHFKNKLGDRVTSLVGMFVEYNANSQ